MKKIISALLIILISGSCLPTLAVENGYSLSRHTLIIEDDTAFFGVLSGWYDEKDEITTIKVRKGVTELPDGCFSGLDNLQSVSLPDSLTLIGREAFKDCPSLKSIDVPAGVREILFSAFESCTSLTEVRLHEGLENIGEYAFFGCKSLEEVNVPVSVETVGDYAFSCCESLSHVSFIGKKTEFSKNTFLHYSETETVLYCIKYSKAYTLAREWKLPFGFGDIIYSVRGDVKIVEQFETEEYLLSGWKTEPFTPKKRYSGSCGKSADWFVTDGTLEITGSGTLDNYAENGAPWYDIRDEISSLVISKGITTVSDGCFANLTHLTEVFVPEGLSEAGKNCLYNCTRIKNFSVEDNNFSVAHAFGESKPRSVTFYCGHYSMANRYAKRNGFSVSLFYDLYNLQNEYMRVSEKEAAEYLSAGWYEVPVCRIYAPDDMSAVVAKGSAAAYYGLGWYSAPVVRMYALDGRSIIVYKSEEYAYSLVGWSIKTELPS